MDAKWPKKKRLGGVSRRRRNTGSTAMMASTSEISALMAMVNSAGRRIGMSERLRASVSTMEEMVMRMLALVSAITLSCA